MSASKYWVTRIDGGVRASSKSSLPTGSLTLHLRTHLRGRAREGKIHAVTTRERHPDLQGSRTTDCYITEVVVDDLTLEQHVMRRFAPGKRHARLMVDPKGRLNIRPKRRPPR